MLCGTLPGVQWQTKHAFLLHFIVFVCSLHLGPSKQMNKQMKEKKQTKANERKKFWRLENRALRCREKHAGLIVSEEVDSQLPACTAERQAVTAKEKEGGGGRSAGRSGFSAW